MGRFTDWLLGIERDAPPARPVMVGFPAEGGLITDVTATTSLGLSAVWRSLDILANGVSQLKWREVRGGEELAPSRIVRRPAADYTRREWTSLAVSTLALYDVAYLLKVGGLDSEGVPMGLLPIPPGLISPIVLDPYSLVMPQRFLLGQSEVDREQLVILRRSPQPGVLDGQGGVLQLARVTFAAALSAERYASRYWQNGGQPTTVLETDQKLNTNEAGELSGRWSERRAKGPDYAPVLSGGVKARSFGADPTTDSAVEARREHVADIGRYFGIPTNLLNAPAGDSETYASVESNGVHLLRFTLSNYIGAIEDAISDQLPGGREMVMHTAPLTSGTQLARAQAWQLATGGQAWISPDEVRQAEGLPPRGVNA